MQRIVLGGGCFWCIESVFLALRGVSNVISGYAGGTPDTANYLAVCTGNTDHVEVVEVVFDDQALPLGVLLDVFFAVHDPTTINRQGNDIGSQYASVIFCDAAQSPIVLGKIRSLQASGLDVVTCILPMGDFYPAESYHQNFYANHPTQGYCNLTIPSKLAKLRADFGDYVR